MYQFVNLACLPFNKQSNGLCKLNRNCNFCFNSFSRAFVFSDDEEETKRVVRSQKDKR